MTIHNIYRGPLYITSTEKGNGQLCHTPNTPLSLMHPVPDCHTQVMPMSQQETSLIDLCSEMENVRPALHINTRLMSVMHCVFMMCGILMTSCHVIQLAVYLYLLILINVFFVLTNEISEIYLIGPTNSFLMM